MNICLIELTQRKLSTGIGAGDVRTTKVEETPIILDMGSIIAIAGENDHSKIYIRGQEKPLVFCVSETTAFIGERMKELALAADWETR